MSFQTIYNGIDIAAKHGAYSLRVSSDTFRAAQVVELYLNHAVMAERGQKPAPGDPSVSVDIALQHVDRLYDAFELGQKAGSFDVKACISIAGQFEKLRGSLVQQRKNERKQVKNVTASPVEAQKIEAAKPDVTEPPTDNVQHE